MAIIDTDPQGTVNNINTHLDNIDKKLKAIVDAQKPLLITAESDLLKNVEKEITDAATEQIKKIQQVGEIPKDTLNRRLRVFPNAHVIAGFLAQIVYENANKEIITYGDLIVSSKKVLYFATGYRVAFSSQGFGWHRIGLQPGIEIIDVVGDGLSFALLEKSKKTIYKTGLSGNTDNTGLYWMFPNKYTFKSSVKKILSGRLTRYPSSSNTSYNQRTLTVVITEDGKVHTQGTNKSGELGAGSSAGDYSEDFKEITLPNNALAYDGAVGFAGHSGSVIILAKENNQSVAYVWGCNINGWLGTGNNNTVWEPKKVYFENAQFYKAWFTVGTDAHGSSDSNNTMQLFCSVGQNENDQFLVGAGHNNQKQITDGSNTLSSFQKCYIGGNTTQPIRKPKRVTGYANKSVIGVITEEGDLYISGQNYGELSPNINSGTFPFQTFRAGTKFYDAWVLMDSNPTTMPSSNNKVSLFMISENQNALYHGGYDYVESANVDSSVGYQELWGDEWINIKDAEFAFTSCSHNSDYEGISVYVVDSTKRLLLFRGAEGNLPVPAKASGFSAIYSLDLGALNYY